MYSKIQYACIRIKILQGIPQCGVFKVPQDPGSEDPNYVIGINTAEREREETQIMSITLIVTTTFCLNRQSAVLFVVYIVFSPV
jgi:hypothetical protein